MLSNQLEMTAYDATGAAISPGFVNTGSGPTEFLGLGTNDGSAVIKGVQIKTTTTDNRFTFGVDDVIFTVSSYDQGCCA